MRAYTSLGMSWGTCREAFTLYYCQAEEPDSPDSIPAWHLKCWTKVDSIAAEESFLASSSSSSSTAWAVGPHRTGQWAGLQLNVKEHSFGPLTQHGFYVAFQALLVAVKLLSACDPELRAFTSFGETQASGARGVAVGTYVAHTELEDDVGRLAGTAVLTIPPASCVALQHKPSGEIVILGLMMSATHLSLYQAVQTLAQHLLPSPSQSVMHG